LGPYSIDPSDTQWVTQAPGYSIFLSGVYSIFGRNFFRAQLVQNALNSFSTVLIFLIAGSLISWRVGVASGVLAALSHHLAHISNFILPDAMHALPVLGAIYLLIIARRVRHSYWLLCGRRIVARTRVVAESADYVPGIIPGGDAGDNQRAPLVFGEARRGDRDNLASCDSSYHHSELCGVR